MQYNVLFTLWFETALENQMIELLGCWNFFVERCDILAPWLVHWLTFYYILHAITYPILIWRCTLYWVVPKDATKQRNQEGYLQALQTISKSDGVPCPTSHNEIKKTNILFENLSINQSKSHIISSLIVAHSLTNPHLNTGCSINFYILTGQKLFGKVEPCPTCSVDQVFDRIGLFQVF